MDHPGDCTLLLIGSVSGRATIPIELALVQSEREAGRSWNDVAARLRSRLSGINADEMAFYDRDGIVYRNEKLDRDFAEPCQGAGFSSHAESCPRIVRNAVENQGRRSCRVAAYLNPGNAADGQG